MDPEQIVTPPADDDFSAAFSKFSEPEPKTAEEPKVESPPAAEGGEGGQEPAAVTGDDPPPGGDPGADGGDPAPAAEPVKAEPTPAEPAAETPPAVPEPKREAPTADDILDRLEKIVTKPEPAAQPKVEQPAAEEAPLYSPEELSAIQEYEKEWPEVARAERLRRRQENVELVQFVFTEVAKQFLPIKEMTEALATRTHAQDIEAKIGAYDDGLRDQVEAWIAKQPDYLQSAYTQVIDTGTSEQVSDLVARFRTETGSATPATKPTAKKGGNELSEPTKQAVAALEPVETKRTVIEQADDPNDFNKAFEKFKDMFKD